MESKKIDDLERFLELANSEYELDYLTNYVRKYLTAFLKQKGIPSSTKNVYRIIRRAEHLIAFVERKHSDTDGAVAAARGLTEMDFFDKHLAAGDAEKAIVAALRASRYLVEAHVAAERNRVLSQPRPYNRRGLTKAQLRKQHFGEMAKKLAEIHVMDTPNWNYESLYAHVAAELQKYNSTTHATGANSTYPSISTVKEWLLPHREHLKTFLD